MTKLIKFRCTRCFYEFEGYPGPNDCLNCGAKYVKEVNAPNIYEEVKVQKKEAVDTAKTEVESGPVDDAFVECDIGCHCG